MIASLALVSALATAPLPRIVEVETKGDTATLCAALAAPEEMSASEQAAWHVLALALREGNQEYTANTIWTQCDEFTVSASDRLLTIQISAPYERLGVMARILRASLTKPMIDEELRKRLVMALESPTDDDLVSLLKGRRGDPSQARASALSLLFTRVYRPENLSLAVSASRTANLNSATVLKAFVDWIPKPSRVDYRAGKMDSFSSPKRAETLMMVGAPVMPTTNDAARILAVFALGVGKESSMHRVLRNGAAMSYRQEALLWATPTGWRPTLLIGGSSPISASKVGELLVQDVESYSEEHRLRALAMAQTCLMRGSAVSPIWVSPSRPYNGIESDRVMWASYWGLLGMGSLTPERLLQDLSTVKLDELKADAKELLSTMMKSSE